MVPLGTTEEHHEATLTFDATRARLPSLTSTEQALDGGAESERVIVIDVGSFQTKVGWASNPEPAATFPSVAANGNMVVDRGMLKKDTPILIVQVS